MSQKNWEIVCAIMDLEAARESRLERIWYACRRVWRNRRGIQNRPILRNYILWFLCIMVLLIVREIQVTVESPIMEEININPVEMVEQTNPDVGGAIPDFFPNLEFWLRSFWKETDTQDDVDVCEEPKPEPSLDVMSLFEELRSLEEIRSDPSGQMKLSKTVSVSVPTQELNVARRTRQKHNLGMQLRRVQEQLSQDITTHDELCLASLHAGVPIRMMVLQTQGILLNPEIVTTSDVTLTRLEATAFEPEVLKQKSRSMDVTVQYYDLEGVTHSNTFSNIDAQCILHLMDAMNAVPF